MSSQIVHDQDAEVLLNALLHEIRDVGLITWNSDGLITSLSGSCRSLMQLPESAGVGGPVSVLWQSPCREFMQAFDRQKAQLKQHYFTRELQLSREGESCWIEIKVRRCPLDCGETSAFMLIVRDISDRRRVAEQAQQTHDLFDAAFRSFNDAAIFVDPDRRIVKVSAGVEPMFGYTQGELVGRSTRMLYTDEDAYLKLGELQKRHDANGWQAQEIISFRRNNGEIFPAETTSGPLRDRNGVLLGYIAILRDFTQRLRLENDLREQTEMLESIFRQLPFALGVIDTRRQIMQMSDSALALFGYSQKEMAGHSTSMIYASEDEFERIGDKIYREQSGEPVIADFKTRSGRAFKGRLQVSPLYDIDGRMKGYLVAIEDVTQQLQHVEHLRRYEEIVSASSDALVFVDVNHVYQAANAVYLNLWQRQRHEVIGRHISEIVGSEFYAHYTVPSLARCFAGEVVNYDEMHVDYPSGSIYVQATHNPYRNEHGEVAGVLITIRDVTHRHLAEQAMLESEEKFHAIFDNAPVGVVILDERDGGILDINPAGLEIYGYPREEYLRLRPWDLVVGITPDNFEEHWKRTIQLQRARLESVHRRKDGSLLHVLIDAMRMTLREQPVVIASLVEITQQKALEERLREREGQYRSLVESTSAILFSLDPRSFRFTFVSQEAETLLGYPTEQWLDSADFWYEHVHPEDREWAKEYCVASRQKRQDHSLEYRMIAADGRIVWLHDLTRVVVVDGRMANLVGVMVDITSQKAAEAERWRLSKIVEQSTEAILLTDTDFLITYVNEAFQQLYGYTLQDLQGKTPELLNTETDAEEIQEDIYAQVMAGKRISLELLNRRKDGSYFTCMTSISPLRDERGRVIAYMGTQRDISKRVQAEAALRASEERWQYALEGAEEGVWDWNAKTDKVYYSRRWKEMLGYREDEIGDSIDEWVSRVHPDDLPGCRAALQRHFSGETENYINEHRVRCKDGSYKWILDRGQIREWAEDGTPLRLIGTHQDVTLRKHAEAALRQSEEKYRRIVETAQEGIWVIDANARTRFVNSSMARMLGYSEEEMTGRLLFEFMDEESRMLAEQRLEERRRGIPGIHEFRFLRRDGTDLWTKVSSNPLFDEKGQFSGAMAMINDISEAHKLQEALIRSQKMEAVGQLTGGIAHDFNNILGSVLGFAELAQDRFGGMDEKLGEYLRQIETAGIRARDLIRQLLIFSRGEHVGAAAAIPLSTLVKEVVKMLMPMLPAMIEIRTDLPQVSPSVKMDPVHVQQLLMNLCINARDAIDGQGVITISLSKRGLRDERCDICGERVDGDWVSLRIADTGRGIPTELAADIFQPFVTSKEVGEGSGMGLAVVAGIVRSYGGHLRIDSRQGQGASFDIILPVAPSVGGDDLEAVGAGEMNLDLRGRKILVVDDELQIRDYFKALLGGNGSEVVCCATGMQALGRFIREPATFDLIISDQSMPGMSGSEMARQLRDLDFRVPIIIYTGYGDILSQETVHSLNIGRLLQKPASRPEILSAIMQLLQVPLE